MKKKKTKKKKQKKKQKKATKTPVKPEKELVRKKLTPKQEKFCRLYATDEEFFGNGVQAYIRAYSPDKSKRNWYNVVKSDASQLLTNPNLLNRLNELLESAGLNDAFVDKQMLFLINQHRDFNAKIRSIAEYNKLKNRITEHISIKTPTIIKLEVIKKYVRSKDGKPNNRVKS